MSLGEVGIILMKINAHFDFFSSIPSSTGNPSTYSASVECTLEGGEDCGELQEQQYPCDGLIPRPSRCRLLEDSIVLQCDSVDPSQPISDGMGISEEDLGRDVTPLDAL